MYFLFFFILLLILIVLKLLTEPVLIDLRFDTDEEIAFVHFQWLGQFLSGLIETANSSPRITIFLFGKKTFSGVLKPRKGKSTDRINLIKSLVLDRTNIELGYNFENPFLTGITTGWVGLIESLINPETIRQIPCFTSDHAYVSLSATTRLNAGKTAYHLLCGRL